MADEKMSPIIASEPPPAGNPLGAKTAAHASTLKLKPVIRKPVIGASHTALRMPTVPKTVSPSAAKPSAPAATPPAAAAAPQQPVPESDALQQLHGLTQKLKGITQEIPEQAILHKTGIIADRDLTEAQKQASKSRTARISLSSAIGVAPVKEEAAPMKTIRIKRPVDLPSARPSAAVAPAMPAAESATTPAPVATDAAPAGEKAPTLTQRKTLKIARPGVGAVRPGFGLKKPGAAPAATAPAAAPAAADEVADIPDVPEMPAPAPAAAAPEGIPDVPSGLAIFDLLLQVAACVAMAFLAYQLYTDASQVWF